MSDLAVGPEELALVNALRRGDEDAFARLVGQHHASLRRVARLYVANASIADEVVQDTWLGVIRGIWAFEGRSSLKTWIFRILVNRPHARRPRGADGCVHGPPLDGKRRRPGARGEPGAPSPGGRFVGPRALAPGAAGSGL